MPARGAVEARSEAENCAFTAEGGDSKLFFAGGTFVTQHAPECCEAPVQIPERRSRFYSHKSDVWAFGTLVLWELMYCACSDNVADMRGDDKDVPKDITRRMYFYKCLGEKDSLAAWETANVSSEALSLRIATQLRQRYRPSGARSEEDRQMFENLCDVLQGMCEGNHDVRASAADSFQRLCGAAGMKHEASASRLSALIAFDFEMGYLIVSSRLWCGAPRRTSCRRWARATFRFLCILLRVQIYGLVL